MDLQKQLFYLKSEAITIDIKLGFREGSLILDGYDFGQRVKELRGRSDHEYHISVRGAELEKLFQLNGIPVGEVELLIEALSVLFSDNKAYSLFRTYLTEHAIKFESFVD